MLVKNLSQAHPALAYFHRLPEEQKAPLPDPQGCAVCENMEAKLCDTCQSIRYCSERCKKLDWKTHQFLCATFKDFAEEPAKDYKRGILLRDDIKEAEWVWVTFKPPTFETADIEFIRGLLQAKDMTANHATITVALVQSNRVLQRNIGAPIYVWSRGQKDTEDRAVNRCIMNMGDGLLNMLYEGHVLLSGHGRSLTASDFRHMVDYFACASPESLDD